MTRKRVGHPKLTELEVLMLREKRKEDGYLNCAHWARKIGVSEQAVHFAVNPDKSYGTWKHLPR